MLMFSLGKEEEEEMGWCHVFLYLCWLICSKLFSITENDEGEKGYLEKGEGQNGKDVI